MTRPDASALSALLDHAARGNGDAFAELVDLTVADAWLLAHLSSSQLADEVVEQVYRLAWQQRSDFRASGLSARAWVLSFTRSSVQAVRAAHAP